MHEVSLEEFLFRQGSEPWLDIVICYISKVEFQWQ